VLLAARRRNADRYDEALATLPGLTPAPRAPWAAPSYWLYTALVDPEHTALTRNDVLDALAEDGIEGRPIWTPLHLMPIHAGIPMLGGAVAQRIFERAVSLPSSSSLSKADQDRVIERLRATLAG